MLKGQQLGTDILLAILAQVGMKLTSNEMEASND
jgi:hypothetical protein